MKKKDKRIVENNLKESFKFNANEKKKNYFNSLRNRNVQIFKRNIMPNFYLVNIYRYTYFKIASIIYLEKAKY